jgi:colanic acid/amylovoran biosynthesis glycosyltransferase
MTKRRIGYLCDHYPALSHTFIRREALALRARGLHISTFSVHTASGQNVMAEGDRKEAETTHNVRPIGARNLLKAHLWALGRRPRRYATTLIEALRTRPRGLKALAWRLFYFGEAIPLAKLVHDDRIDHLHNHFANSGADVGYLTARYLDIPWSLTLHGTSCFEYPSGQTLGAKIRFASFVACVSDFGRAQAMRTVPRSYWDKLHIVRCGLDIRQAASGTRPSRAEGDRVRLMCVARMSEEKGLPVLIAALALLLRDGVDVELCLVGDGPERALIENEIRSNGLEQRVELTGALPGEQLIARYAACDIFVLTSFMEGLPVVLMEAMAASKPVVAPSVGGIPELVLHGETGLLFNPADSDALARQLKRLIADPALRTRLGEAGRRKVEQQHSLERAVEPLVRLFQHDGEPPGPSPRPHKPPRVSVRKTDYRHN